MNRYAQQRHIVLAGLVLLGGAAWSANAAANRFRTVEEPQWLKLRITRTSVGLYLEGDYDVTRFDGGSETTYSRWFVGPEIGLDLAGSIYHPNLCTFALMSQGAYGTQQQRTDGSASSTSRDQMQYLGRAVFSANLLNNKPLRAGVSAGVDHSYRDYDFFSRVTVDSLSYDGRVSYEVGPWNFTSTYAHRDEDITGSVAPSSTVMDAVSFMGRHTRARGATDFGYTFTQYDYASPGSPAIVTRDQLISLADSERLGSENQGDLRSYASYSEHEATLDSANDQILAGTELSVDHPHRLRSDYTLNYDRYTSGQLESVGYSGRAGVRHQLYDSLTSALAVYGSRSDYSDLLSDGYNNRLGVQWGEFYTKRIGPGHTLRINNSLSVERVDQQGIATVENEPHSFSTDPLSPTPDGFFLDQPYVVTTSIEVRNATTGQPYFVGVDYDVIVNGSRTLLQRRTGGAIPAGTAVLVDYQAEPQPAATYDNYSEFFNIRLDLWNNFWGLYAGVAFSRANAPDEVRVLDYTRMNLGTDLRWRQFQVGAELERYESDDSTYDAYGFFQSAALTLDDGANVGLNLSERWVEYVDAGYSEQQYRLTAQYQKHLSSRLRFTVHTGASYRTGRFDDETLAVLRPTLRYVIGQTSLSADYNLEYSLTGSDEERLRNSLRISVNRRF
jgi:hypothetical protein